MIYEVEVEQVYYCDLVTEKRGRCAGIELLAVIGNVIQKSQIKLRIACVKHINLHFLNYIQ